MYKIVKDKEMVKNTSPNWKLSLSFDAWRWLENNRKTRVTLENLFLKEIENANTLKKGLNKFPEDKYLRYYESLFENCEEQCAW